ncbi:hypothetical protein FGG08_007180 [Glutinoglossum americanum]|uniref:HMG box domain-containing protein n=1 Tax=Glutinoglossum americanum TaxID=1670608 RepID=A0A9P8KU80_9PEZI|nr:hypothetical protein FGG08_007180 [Glutinoglossum americanum]
MDSLGNQGILTIMQRFSAFTSCAATLTLDQESGTLRITRGAAAGSTNLQGIMEGVMLGVAPNLQVPTAPQLASATPLPTPVFTPTLDAKSKVTPRKAPRKTPTKHQPSEKVPRPPNAFILYRKHHHPQVKADNPGVHNNTICRAHVSLFLPPSNEFLAIILGRQWQNETEQVRAHFKALSDEIKRKHYLDHPEYQYQPRKPSELKRRTSRRKAIDLTAIPKAVPTLLQPNTPGTPARGTVQTEALTVSQSPPIPIPDSEGPLELENVVSTGFAAGRYLGRPEEVFGNASAAVAEPTNNAHKNATNFAPAAANFKPATIGNPSNNQSGSTSSDPAANQALSSTQRFSTNAGTAASETLGNAQGNVTSSSPAASQTSGSAQGDAISSGTAANQTPGSAQENLQNGGVASVTSNGMHGVGNGSRPIPKLTENQHGGVQLTLPYEGDEEFLAQLLGNWNRMHPMPPFGDLPHGVHPVTITQTDESFNLLDRDVLLVNWGELAVQAQEDLLQDEQDFLKAFTG